MNEITKKYVNTKGGQIEWQENEFGIAVPVETKIEVREKMTRAEWKEYFNNEEITREEYIEEQKTFLRSLNGHM